MKAEIIDSCRTTGLFKGIVDGCPSYPISPRPHEEIVAIAMFIQPVQSLAASFIDRNGFRRMVLVCMTEITPRSKFTLSQFKFNSSPCRIPVLSANVTKDKSHGEVMSASPPLFLCVLRDVAKRQFDNSRDCDFSDLPPCHSAQMYAHLLCQRRLSVSRLTAKLLKLILSHKINIGIMPTMCKGESSELSLLGSPPRSSQGRFSQHALPNLLRSQLALANK